VSSPVSSFSFDKQEKKLSFIINANDSGFCNITIPRNRLDGPFDVMINDTAVSYNTTQSPPQSCLYFTYTVGIHYVKVIGTKRGYIIGDLNGDGKVNILDVAIAARNYDHNEEDYP